MNKSDLERLVDIRLEEARSLLASGYYHGAYYLAGYSIECALKACIAKQVNQYDFPDKQLAHSSHSHKLTDLVGVAGLKQKLSEREVESTDFSLYWAIVKDWNEASRYETIIEKTRAEDLLNAITEQTSGVLPWLRLYL